jgi:antitoxin HigA-1
MLDAATRLSDLRSPPLNQLEGLKRDRLGQHSIRINGSGACVFGGRPMGPKTLSSWTIIKLKGWIMPRVRTHPGEVLREEYLVPLGMSAQALAKALGVPANRITEIMRGDRDISADTAIRLGRYFGTDPRFWINLQAAHDLSVAEAGDDYSRIAPRSAA